MSAIGFGKYELVSRLARGGMAETWRAQLKGAAGVTKTVVIKKVLPHFAEDPQFTEAFINEAKLSASLSHGNIAQIFDFGEVDGAYFLAMELVDGRSLGQLLGRAGERGFVKLPVPIACYLAIEVLKGLHYAHTRLGPEGQPLRLVHRDVTPENVIVSFEGEVKVVDFGVAKAAMRGRRETEPGLVKGKFLFFSPEQAVADPLDARSDVYAVGVLLYRMLCGGLPFEGQMHTVMRAIALGRFVPPLVLNPALPHALVAVINRAMAKNREERFASALQMQEALASYFYRQNPTFSAETVKEWMAWLFRPELEAEGRTVALSGRFEQQLSTWGRAGNEVATSPGVAALTKEAEAATGAHPKLDDPKDHRPMLFSLGALAAVLALGGYVVFGDGEPVPARREGAAPVQTPGEVAAPVVAAVPEPVRVDAGPAVTPDQARAGTLLANAERAMLQDDLKQAASQLLVCLRLDPQRADCHKWLGTVLALQGRPHEAQDAYRAFLRTAGFDDPDVDDVRAALDAWDGTPEGAKRLPFPCCRARPAYAPPVTAGDTYFTEGKNLMRDKQHAAATGPLQKCIRVDPGHAECHKLLGTAWAKLGEPEKGEAEYRAFLKFAPPNHPDRDKVQMILRAFAGKR